MDKKFVIININVIAVTDNIDTAKKPLKKEFEKEKELLLKDLCAKLPYNVF